MELPREQRQEDRPSEKRDDYSLLPRGVMPTPLEVLEQAGDLLFIKRFAPTRNYSPKQRQIMETLVQLGQGTIWFLSIWPKGTIREIEVLAYDGQLHGSFVERATLDQEGLRAWICNWFLSRRGAA